MRDKRRWVEWGKDALIILLTLSAVYLLSMTPLIQDSGLLDMFRSRPAGGSTTIGTALTGAVLPSRLAIYRDGERYGLQYNDTRMAELFAALDPLLGDALASAGEPWTLTEQEWQRCLQQKSVYFDFSGDIPLTALNRWLSGGEENAPVGSARRVVLTAGENDQVVLCWQDETDGAFYACGTALSHTLHLDPAVDGITANGAYFAFEDPGVAQLLAPYTLITEGNQAGVQYSVTSPLASSAGVEAMLEALSFNSQNHAPGSSGEVYLDGADRLVVEDSGSVTYRAAEGGKYPVGTQSAAQAADGARAIAEGVMGPLCGEARLYLISVKEHEDGWRVCFGYRLNGSAVYLYDEGWAAEFVVSGGCITEFTLHLRCYTAVGENTLLLPIDKAAVMLPDLKANGHELVIQYLDGGGATVSPRWEAI